MKKFIYLTIFLLSLGLNAQIKNGYAVYSMKFNTDPAFYKDKNHGEKGLQMFKMLNSLANNLRFDLYFNKKASLFKIDDALVIDSKLKDLALVLSKGKGIYYLTNNQLIKQIDAFGDTFLIKDSPLKPSDWNLSNESKKIKGFICYKATSNIKINDENSYHFEAWYCPEIQTHFGPIGISNLPGLIFELKMQNVSEVTYSLESIKFNNDLFDKKIIKPKKGNVVSKKEFDKIGKKMMLKAKGF